MLPSAHPFCTPDVIAAPPITADTLAIVRVAHDGALIFSLGSSRSIVV